MKIFKNKKAITLIALVITIVVLIILAGVAINLTLGDNGIFNKAKYAKEEYLNAKNEEEAQLAKVENIIDDYIESSRNENNNYSTTAQRIGTWIDGKPIYRKVINCTTKANGTIYDASQDNVDVCIKLDGFLFSSDMARIPICFVPIDTTVGIQILFQSDKTLQSYATFDPFIDRPCVLIMEYTRTTDTVPQ